MSKTWKCRLGWHAWIRRPANPDPNLKVCRRCGKHTDVGGLGGLGARFGPG
jgi:hypothetical protein